MSEARSSLSPGGILIALNEFSALCPPCPSESEGLPVVITSEDLRGAHEVPKWLPPLDDLPSGASLARRIFNIGPRYFDLTVEFGAEPDRADFDRANEVIGSLVIEDWHAEPNGQCQWNEIGMRDPDCPQPHWLRDVLTRAGFDIKEVGGTFVGRKVGVEFFISVEELEDVSQDHLDLLEDPRAYPVREEVEGITVYGSDLAWEWLTDEMRVRLDAGPDGDSPFPSIQQLKPLIQASREVPYPPQVPPTDGSTTASPTASSEQRLGVYEAMIRKLVEPDGFGAGEEAGPIVIHTKLCSHLRGDGCAGRIRHPEQEALAERLADLGVVQFVDGLDPGEAGTRSITLLGPIRETPEGLRVEGGYWCGFLCAGGSMYIVEQVDSGYRVVGKDLTYGSWVS